MARNQDQRQSKGQALKVLERGDIYFVYRPKVEEAPKIEEAAAEGWAEVQRLYMILRPYDKKRYRLIIIGQKRLPEIDDAKQQTWGFVDKVSRAAQAMKDALASATYHTKTRGERIQPEARPAGEGIYAIVRHDDHTHLVYAMELPSRPGAVQQAFHLEEEGSYILSVKNPEQPSPRGVGLDESRRASFPKTLQTRFRGRRFIAVDPPNFLNYEGAEVLLVGASEDIAGELGLQLQPQAETAATAEIFNDLRLERSRHAMKPLFEGQWQ
jgi:hypothetical protein